MTPKIMTRIGLRVVLSLTALSSGLPLLAADDASKTTAVPTTLGHVLSDKYYAAFGGFIAELSTDAQASKGQAIGTALRAEDQLGLDSKKTTYRLFFQGRFNPRHSLGFDYLAINRTGTNTLSKQIEYDGTIYDVGASLTSKFKVAQLALDYRYSFVNNGKTEAGILTGLSVFDFSASLEGQATVDDGAGGTTTAFAKAGDSFVAPVPKVGMFIRQAFLRNLIFQANAAFFRVTVGDTLVKMSDTSFLLDYYFSKHVGIGGGVNSTTLVYQNKSTTSPMRVEYQQTGVLLYAALVF